MKLSINEGPYVGATNVGFSISHEHCRELSDFLWGWVLGLPEAVSQCVEVITVNPSNPQGVADVRRVVVKVVLSGKYNHYTPGRVAVLSEAWKSSFEECFYDYLPNEPGDLIKDKEELKKRLNRRLTQTIELEIRTHQSLLDDLSAMFKSELLDLV